MALNPNHADWYHFPIVFDHFNKGEYDQALVNAQKMNLPRFFWAHATRAAIFGHLGRRDDAEKAVAELLALYPDFTDHARDELRKWNFAPDLIERTIDGLRKAGLDIPEPAAAAAE
jgi:tetratricopeptide (TPR) repeat protein